MKKVFRSVVAVILAVLCAVPCFATGTAKTATQQTTETEYPIIVIRGMDFSGLTLDMGTENETGAVKAFDTSALIQTIGKALLAGVRSFSFDAIVDEILVYVNDMMGALACDKNGDSLYNVTTVTYPGAVSNYPGLYADKVYNNEQGMVKTLADRYGAENVYFYVYDWRLNPLDNADLLKATIDGACREHGTDKVNTVCASMGGAQIVAYMNKYGSDSLASVLFMSAAFSGTYVASDLFQGKVKITSNTLYNFASFALSGNSFASTLIKFAKAVGVFKIAELFAGWFTETYKQKAFDGFLRDTFGTMPGFWALVMENDFDACYQYIFGSAEEEYAKIASIAKELHEVALERDCMLREAAANGLKVAVVANYNTPLIPVYDRACAHGDGTLETAPMSGGAIVANYGDTLDIADGKYISADKVIDASTALFKDYTWFVKNAPHVACRSGSDYADFMVWLLEFDGQPSIDSSESYPQFMISDENQTLSALK